MKLNTSLLVAFVGSVCWFGGYVHGHSTSTVTVIKHAETIEEFAKTQPPYVQANLLVVAGAHHSNADRDLALVLYRFAGEMVKKLKQENAGDL